MIYGCLLAVLILAIYGSPNLAIVVCHLAALNVVSLVICKQKVTPKVQKQRISQKMLALQSYASSSEDEASEESDASNVEARKLEDAENFDHLKPPEDSEFSVKKQLEVCATPVVLPTVGLL